MRAVVFDRGAVTLRDDVPAPVELEGETRVEVITAGICATDLALRRGYMGFAGVPGHEFVGRALDGPLAGQRVVGEINAGCGRCEGCRNGDPRHCPERTVLGILGRPGAFADRLTLPNGNLRPVPDGVTDTAAVFTEPLAAAWQLTTQVDIPEGLPALVAGDGRLGLLCAWALSLRGATVTVAGHHAERAALLPHGVVHVTDLLDDDGPSAPAWPLAVEATGHPDVLPRLLEHVHPRGTIVLKTTCEQPTSLDLANVVVQEHTLIGSRCGRLQPALDLLRDGLVPVERLVAARYPLADVDAALAHAARHGALKVLLDVAAEG